MERIIREIRESYERYEERIGDGERIVGGRKKNKRRRKKKGERRIKGGEENNREEIGGLGMDK